MRFAHVFILFFYALGAMTFTALGIGAIRDGDDTWAAPMIFFAAYFAIRFAVFSDKDGL